MHGLFQTQSDYAGKSINFLRKNTSTPSSAKDVANLLNDNTVVPWSSTNGKNVTIITNDKEYTFSGTIEKDGTNFLGLIVFSILLGIILRKLGEDGRALLAFVRSWLHVVMMLVSWIMWYVNIPTQLRKYIWSLCFGFSSCFVDFWFCLLPINKIIYHSLVNEHI